VTKAGVTPGAARPRLTLHDGRVVQVRPLELRDRAGLAAAVSRLFDETRYMRFATPKPRLTEQAQGSNQGISQVLSHRRRGMPLERVPGLR
jgi:hypothetical protein